MRIPSIPLCGRTDLLLDSESEIRLSHEALKDKILEVYKKEGMPLTPRWAAKVANINQNTAKRIARELHNAGSRKS